MSTERHNARRSRRLRQVVLTALCSLAVLAAHADELRLLVARTANQTGLMSHLADAYQADHPGIQIHIIDRGALQTIEQGREGAADAIISHAPEAELLFMSDGYGLSRTLFMYNQFAIFGPPGDPLRLRQQTDLLTALRTIAAAEPPFLVQGDRSGTYHRLVQLWTAARIRPTWLGYETTYGGSPATLSTAAEFGAYAFADLGSYFSLPAEKRSQLVPLVRDHRALRNNYHYIVVNPDRVAGVNRRLAEDFLDFLTSDRAQRMIGQFGSDMAPAPLYTPAAHIDRDLRIRRSQGQIASQQRHMYLLSAALVVALSLTLFGAFIYRRARELTRRTLLHADRQERVIAASRAGLLEWDMVAGTLYYTPQTLTLLGLPSTDARNLHALLRQALDNSEASRVSMALQQAVAVSDQELVRIGFRCRDRHLELCGQPERDGQGNPIRLSATLHEREIDQGQPNDGQGLTLRDELTGLPNRQLLADRLQHALTQCSRSHAACMVLIVGIHAVRAAGGLSDTAPDDEVIKAVAARLRQLLRASDTIARLEQANFAVLLPASDEQHCRLAVEKLQAGLERPFHIQHRSVHVDSAIGCAIYPNHGEQHHSLLQRAQLAMLQATRDGAPLVVYQPPDKADDDTSGEEASPA